MNKNSNQLLLIKNLESIPYSLGSIIICKSKICEILNEINNQKELNIIKNKIIKMIEIIKHPKSDKYGLLNIDPNGDTISIRKDVLISEFNQILNSQTIKRAKYYLTRLENGFSKVKTNNINDINLLRWKEYDNIITDSLWILDKRDTSGAHIGWYWGNIINHQMDFNV